MENLTLDNAEKNLEKIIKSYNDINKIRNEAETRFHLIDELIEKCFGWDKSQIKVETYEKNNGFTDYELGIPRSIIIEAKKEGISFELPPAMLNDKNIIDIPSLMKMNNELKDVIIQVQRYGAQRGAVCVVATNGHQFIIFLPTNTNGQNPLEGNALVFSSLSNILENFKIAWDAISYVGIRERRILQKLGTAVLSIPSKFSSEINIYPKPLSKDELQNELTTLAQVLIQDYMMKPEFEKDFYENCYCENGALSKYSLQSKTILRNRYSNLFIDDKQVISSPVKNKKNDAIDPSLFASAMSDRPIILIGDVGIGKTSFIKNLTYSSAYKEFKDAIYIYIDLGSNAILSGKSLDDYIIEDIKDQLYKKYEIDIDEEKFIKRSLKDEISKFDKGIFGKYKQTNPEKYNEKLDELLEKEINNKDKYINKSIKFITKERRRQTIICLDNADQRDTNIQQEAFLVAQEIAKSWGVLTFISMRPQTFFNSKKNGVMAAYPQHVFTISPPKTSDVINKRLIFAKKIANGDIDFLDSVELSLKNFSDVVDIMLNSFESSNGDSIYEFIENIMNGNIRNSLEFIVDLIGSPGLDSKEKLEIFRNDGRYILPLHEFTKYAILNNNFYYDKNSSIAMNLFDVEINNSTNEHFLCSLLISYISDTSGKSNDKDFIPYNKIINELQNYSFTESQITNSITNCINKKLLEKENRLTFIEDPSEKPENAKYRVTSVGLYHVKKWIGEFAYIDAMLFDTPILDEEVKAEVRRYVHSITMYDRYMRATKFKEYLTKCWNNMSKKPPYFDFLSVLESQNNTFDRVFNYISKKYPENDI